MDELDSEAKRNLHLAIGSHYSLEAKEQWRDACQSGDVDWQATANLAFPVGLAPLFFSSLEMGDPESIPSNVLTTLKNSYFETASINTLAFHHLKIILRQFARNDVPIMLLKGAALLFTAYEKLALRPMVDIDLLIAYANLNDTLKILEGLGYFTQYPLPLEDESGLFWNELMLGSDQDGSLTLELHWSLIDNPYYTQRLPVEMLFQQAQTATWDSITALILSPEDQILHLCIHNFYHHLGQFQRAAVDVAFFVQKNQSNLEWESLIKTAKSNDMSLALATTLLSAAEDWFAPIPDDVLATMRNVQPSRKETFFLACQRSEFLKIFRTFVTLPGTRMKSQFLLGQLSPSPDYMTWRYGTSTHTSKPVLYTRRYLSGLLGLFTEITKPIEKSNKRKKT